MRDFQHTAETSSDDHAQGSQIASLDPVQVANASRRTISASRKLCAESRALRQMSNALKAHASQLSVSARRYSPEDEEAAV